MYLTYRELQKRIHELTEEQLDMEAILGFDVNDGSEATFEKIYDTILISELEDTEELFDFFDGNDNPIMVVSY